MKVVLRLKGLRFKGFGASVSVYLGQRLGDSACGVRLNSSSQERGFPIHIL